MEEKFLFLIKHQLDSMSKEQMAECLMSLAKRLPKEKEQKYLSFLKKQGHNNNKEAGSTYKPRMSEQLVKEKYDEIMIWMDDIMEQKLYLQAEGYEDYSSGHWDSDWAWEYEDPMRIGDKIERAILFAKDCINDRNYKTAWSILDRILKIEVMVVNDCDEMFIELEEMEEENIVYIDLKEFMLMLLYATYQIQDKGNRGKSIYTYFEYPLFRDIHVEEVFKMGRESLNDEDEFWKDWIGLLETKKGSLETRLLKEAALYAYGTDGLAEIAKRNYKIHPSLYLDTLKEYERNYEYKKMSMVGREAIERIDSKYIIKAKIALQTSFAEHYLGNDEIVKELWYRVYVSHSNVINFLRLFSEDTMAQSYGKKAIKTPRIVKDNILHNTGNTELEENIISSTYIPYLNFFFGEFQKVYEACVNPENSLGWSSCFIGRGISLFLVYLYQGKCLEKAVQELAGSLAFNFGFDNNEEFYFFTDDITLKGSGYTELFWLVFSKWKTYFIMKAEDKVHYVQWIEDIIEKRTKAIVGGQFRNHYKRVALLIAALSEVKESMGYQGAKQHLRKQYKELFPRHSAFQSELRFYMG